MFNSLKSPIFLKSTSNAELQLQKLHEIEPKLNPEGKALIQQDIKFLEYGIAGEKNVAFELKTWYSLESYALLLSAKILLVI